LVFQAPSLSGKSQHDEMDEQQMSYGADMGFPGSQQPQQATGGYTQEQVEGI